MKIYFVVGESSAYAERLKWNVDAWMERPLAAARATQLEALVKQLGWPAPLGSFFTDTNFRMMITGLNTAEDGDPNAAWNGNVQWIDYTVEEIELHLTRGAVGEDGGFSTGGVMSNETVEIEFDKILATTFDKDGHALAP